MYLASLQAPEVGFGEYMANYAVKLDNSRPTAFQHLDRQGLSSKLTVADGPSRGDYSTMNEYGFTHVPPDLPDGNSMFIVAFDDECINNTKPTCIPYSSP